MKQRATHPSVVPVLGVDLLLILAAALVALLFARALAPLAEAPVPPAWLIFLSILGLPVFYLLRDGLNAPGNRLKLPFSVSPQRTRQIYAGRLHLVLLTLYFNAIVVALCWSATAMAVTAKLYLAAVFAIAIFALGKSIPSTRLSFALSGILFVVVLLATQTFIVTKGQAEAEQAETELRERLSGDTQDDDDG